MMKNKPLQLNISFITLLLHNFSIDFISSVVTINQKVNEHFSFLINEIILSNLLQKKKPLCMQELKRWNKAKAEYWSKLIFIKQNDEFLQRIHQTIYDNMNKEGFGVQMLCKMVYMSRTQLHLRIKAVTNRSTSHYIRFVRIEKACQLLRETDLYISQIALEVGIESLPYFSRIFSDEVGMSPLQYRNICKIE